MKNEIRELCITYLSISFGISFWSYFYKHGCIKHGGLAGFVPQGKAALLRATFPLGVIPRHLHQYL